MGRHKLYHTKEELKEARRIYQRRYREKKKARIQEQKQIDEFLGIINTPMLYKTKPKRNLNERKVIHDLMSINTSELYVSKPKDRFFKSLMDLPVSQEKPRIKQSIFNIGMDVYQINPRKSSRLQHKEEKKQLGLALTSIKSKKPFITFDIDKLSDKEYFFDELPDVLMKFLDSITLDEDRWIIYYDYGSGWKGKTLSSLTEKFLRNQLEEELDKSKTDYTINEQDYDFFPFGIRNLKRLSLINFSEIQDYKVLNELISSGASKKVINRFIMKRKKREGRFWKWYLKIPEINLSRFMIFHELGKEQVKLIERDNCFIYACAQSGLDETILNDLRYSIHKRSISTADITKAAKECDLTVRIEREDGNNKVIGHGSHQVNLLLMFNHYMINERVNVSPYYIKHRNEINRDPLLRTWPINKRMTIKKKNDGYYKLGTDFSLKKVLKALFEVEAFKPITSGDYMTFNSLICFEKIDSIKTLEYNERYCCRLKANFRSIH